MFALLPAVAAAETPPPAEGTVLAVDVRGTSRVDEAVIFAAIGTRPGQPIDRTRVGRDVAAIFETGLFDDVVVLAEDAPGGVRLAYVVTERPAVREVRFTGLSHLDEDDAREAVGALANTIPTERALAGSGDRVRDALIEKGFLLAEVHPRLDPVAGGLVDAVFAVEEGHKVTVAEVAIVGNDALADRAFTRHLTTRAGGPLPSLLGRGAFRREDAVRDAAIVRELYLEHGHVDAEVSEPEVFLTPDGRRITVTFRVVEGPAYTLGEIRATGDFVPQRGLTEHAVMDLTRGYTVADLQEEAWRRATDRPRPVRGATAPYALAPGATFAISKVRAVSAAITDLYGDQGYAFAEVTPLPFTAADDARVDVTFTIAAGDRFRVGRIDVVGNDPTFDEVVRRELLVNEGESYRGAAVRMSEARLARLGYFETATITSAPASTPGELDLRVDIAERPTGTFGGGIGVGQSTGPTAQLNFSEQNLFGLGWTGSGSVNLARTQRNVSLSFHDPWFLDTRWSLGAAVYSTRDQLPTPNFRNGGSLQLGRTFGRLDRTRVGASWTFEDAGLLGVDAYQQRLFGGDLFRSGTSSTLGANVTWDGRDNVLQPTEGIWFTAGVDLVGGARVDDRYVDLLGGDLSLARAHAKVRVYEPLVGEDDLVFRLQSQAAVVSALDGRVVPFIQRYRLGGPETVRGYLRNSLGPSVRVAGTEDPQRADEELVVGGSGMWVTNAELETPLLRSAQVSGVAFFDAGSAFGEPGDKLVPSVFELRYGVGAGIRWRSPMGLIRLEYGYPLTPEEGAKRGAIEWSFGAQF